MTHDTKAVLTFLASVGFTVREGLTQDSFLSAACIEEGGRLVADLQHPRAIGDLLHESGPLAIIPSVFRNRVYGDVDATLAPLAAGYMENHAFLLESTDHRLVENPVIRGLLQAGEQEAQAWSYAAAIAAGVNPGLVFDDAVEEGLAGALLGLRMKAHAGINGLIAGGMTSRSVFPSMLRWFQI